MDAWFKKSETGVSRRLAHHIPRSSRGYVLVTTRNQQIAKNFARHFVSEVLKLDMNASMHLLQKARGQKEILGDDDNNTEQLLQQLCFIPLAIVQAGAYMNMTHITILEYLSLLNYTEESLVGIVPEGFDDDWSTTIRGTLS
ncbi:hypothetical protein V1527DRAFT_483834 [Lipomyces starkeyi]